MVLRTCNICGKSFNRKSSYDSHMNRKFKCGSDISDASEEKLEIMILESPKIEKRIDKHYDKGSETSSDFDDFDDFTSFDFDDSDDVSTNYDIVGNHNPKDQVMIDELKFEFERFKRRERKSRQQIQKLKASSKKEVEKLQHEINTLKGVDVNIVNTNSNNTVNNNFVLVGYGSEDMTKIDKDKILACIARGAYQSTVRLTDVIHFDPDHPENHNIYISNMKNKYAMEYKNNQWNLVTKTELIDKIYRNKKEYIEENIDEFYKGLNNKQRQSLDDWLNIDDEHEKVKKIKNDIMMLLFNKRNVIKRSSR